MNFFQYFPTLRYPLQDGNTHFDVSITNITAHVVIMEKLKQHITVFNDYVIADGDRPDTVAAQVYGGPEYTWLVLVINNITTHYDWPLTELEFDRYITDKYAYLVPEYASILDGQTAPGWAIDRSQWRLPVREKVYQQFVHKTALGFLVDETTYNNLAAEDRGVRITLYDHEWSLNEAKRRIKVIPQEFVTPLLDDLKRAFA
jgi:hypothetical protein